MRVEPVEAREDDVGLDGAILLYGSNGSNSGRMFATVHSVTRQNGTAPVIGPGECLTRDAVERALSGLLQRPQRREIIPANVLYAGDTRLCWYAPSARRPIFFKTADAKFNSALNGKQVLHPALVFIASSKTLHIFALERDERPSAETKLYCAPYNNIYGGGMMCAGNAVLPSHVQINSLPVFERAFWETNFTHSNNGKLVLTEGGHDAFWRRQLKSNATVPGAETLIPAKVTLQQALDR